MATAYQESSLRNRPNGDRDSVGLFQQRPSQGWGTAEQIMDPVYAAGKFYDALVEVAGLAEDAADRGGAGRAVLRLSGRLRQMGAAGHHPGRALGGAAPLGLTCIAGAQAPTGRRPARTPLTGASTAPSALVELLAAAEAELGGLKLVAASGSTAIVTVTVPGVPTGQGGRALAAWGVAHGTGFTVTALSVDEAEVGRSSLGYRPHGATARPGVDHRGLTGAAGLA